MAITLKSTFAVLVSALTLAACATNTSGATAVAGADAFTASMEGQTAPDGSVIKCRSMQVIGTRFPVKDCKSENAWSEYDKMMAENAKSSTDGLQRLRSGCATRAEGSC